MRLSSLLLLLIFIYACIAEDYYKTLVCLSSNITQINNNINEIIQGLSKDASPKQIKTAFRQLSLKYHPDKNPDDPSMQNKI